MASSNFKKRKVEDGMRGKVTRPFKKVKKQQDYQSSSEDGEQDNQGFQAVNLRELDEDARSTDRLVAAVESVSEDQPRIEEDESEDDTDAADSKSESDSASEAGMNPNMAKKRKRNDPEAFATSMSKILGSQLAKSKRSDPVLSRSTNAIQTSKEITDQVLEKKAKSKLRAERREALDKGRVKDVLGASTAFDAAHGRSEGSSVQEVVELEKRLRKTAQRGVVKLFNAVRAAQIKGEEAAREARERGLVGQGRREEKINEMSKKGFLDLITGTCGLKPGTIEEA